MDLTYTKKLIVLEALRKTKSKPNHPITEEWEVLKADLEGLLEDNLLSIDRDRLVISKEGKKALLLFDSQRKELLSELDPYSRVQLTGYKIDGRLPVLSWLTRKDPNQMDILFNFSLLLWWSEYFDLVKDYKERKLDWMPFLTNETLTFVAKSSVSSNMWKTLGTSIPEAKRTAVLLTNPANRNNNKLVQITR